MPLPGIFKKRRSVRKFKPNPIPDRDIEAILKAASLAPTARNVQPWEFIVVTDSVLKAGVAKLAERNASFIADAPVCIVVLCQDTKYYLEDGSAATTQALLAATALGYGGCWCAGDKKEYAQDVKKLLGAPGSFKLVSLIALGVADETPILQKRDLKEMIHRERF